MKRGWLVVALTLAALVSGCAYTGEDAASAQLQKAQASLVRELERYDRYDDPVWLARWAADDSRRLSYAESSTPQFVLTVEPLNWYADGPAGVLDVRLRVDAAAYDRSSVGERSYSAGSAERCLRITVGREVGGVVDTLNCAGRTGKPVPPPNPVPPLGDAERAQLSAALKLDSFPSARQRVEQAFPAPDFVVQAEVIDAAWAISVIRPVDYECIGGTRSPDGQVKVFAPDRAMMAPGEGGCDPDWFARPFYPN